MTDTERIATALLGWIPRDTPMGETQHGKFYRLPGSHSQEWACVFPDGSWKGFDWPAFTTLDGCRQFEDALAEGVGHFTGSGALQRYIHFLQDGTAEHSHVAALRATTDKRIAACLKVLDEARL